MPVVKGGVWTNIEDEILKASGQYMLSRSLSRRLGQLTTHPSRSLQIWLESMGPRLFLAREEDAQAM